MKMAYNIVLGWTVLCFGPAYWLVLLMEGAAVWGPLDFVSGVIVIFAWMMSWPICAVVYAKLRAGGEWD